MAVVSISDKYLNISKEMMCYHIEQLQPLGRALRHTVLIFMVHIGLLPYRVQQRQQTVSFPIKKSLFFLDILKIQLVFLLLTSMKRKESLPDKTVVDYLSLHSSDLKYNEMKVR